MLSKRQLVLLGLFLLGFVFYSCRSISSGESSLEGLRDKLEIYYDASKKITLLAHNETVYDRGLLGESKYDPSLKKPVFKKYYPHPVTGDFYLPLKADRKGSVDVEWKSNNSAIVIEGDKAKVIRPEYDKPSQNVQLVATLKKLDPRNPSRVLTKEKEFNFLVLRKQSDFGDIIVPAGNLVDYLLTENENSFLNAYRNSGALEDEDLSLYRAGFIAKKEASERAVAEIAGLMSLTTSSLGMHGLAQLGNTCFFNSAMQILLHTPFLKTYLEHVKLLSSYQLSEEDFKNKAPFTVATKEFFSGYFTSTDGSVYPPFEKEGSLLWKTREELYLNVDGRQEDAAQFIERLFEKLKSEYNTLFRGNGLPNLSPAKVFSDVNFAMYQGLFSFILQNAAEREYLEPLSLVFNSFFQKNKSYIVGSEGSWEHKRDIVFEPLFLVALDLPKSEEKVNLTSLLDSQGAEAPAIPFGDAFDGIAQTHSKRYLSGSKKISFAVNTPSYLPIQLKRFHGTDRRLNTEVNYPPEFEKDGVTYELYGVSIQSGTLSGGHYTAYVKDGPQWYLANDSSITEIKADEALSEKVGAYLLFYRKKSI